MPPPFGPFEPFSFFDAFNYPTGGLAGNGRWASIALDLHVNGHSDVRATNASPEFNYAPLTPGNPAMVPFDPTAPFHASVQIVAPAANAATPDSWFEIDPVNDLSDRRFTAFLEWNQGAPGFVTITTISSVSTVAFVAASTNQLEFVFDGTLLTCNWNGVQVGLAPAPAGAWPAAFLVIGGTLLFTSTARINFVNVTQP